MEGSHAYQRRDRRCPRRRGNCYGRVMTTMTMILMMTTTTTTTIVALPHSPSIIVSSSVTRITKTTTTQLSLSDATPGCRYCCCHCRLSSSVVVCRCNQQKMLLPCCWLPAIRSATPNAQQDPATSVFFAATTCRPITQNQQECLRFFSFSFVNGNYPL